MSGATKIPPRPVIAWSERSHGAGGQKNVSEAAGAAGRFGEGGGRVSGASPTKNAENHGSAELSAKVGVIFV